MDILDFTRCRALNNVPSRKVQEKLQVVNDSDADLSAKNVKLIAYNRYHESNIPLEYWDLKMEKNFVGDDRLKQKYMNMFQI